MRRARVRIGMTWAADRERAFREIRK